MEFDVSYSLDNEQQFWDGRVGDAPTGLDSGALRLERTDPSLALSELEEIVSADCESHAVIDSTLRSYLSFTTNYKGRTYKLTMGWGNVDEYLNSEFNVSRCSYKLISSSLFAAHAEYVRWQIIYGLLQDDDPSTLLLITSFLLFDGRQNETTFEMMNKEGAFPRLLELIQAQRKNGVDGDGPETGLHRMLMELLYEMSRIQRVKIEDLVQVDDDFVRHLFEIIEQLSNDVNDPYHYPVIRVLLILNEQFMVCTHEPAAAQPAPEPPTNKVIKVLSMHGNAYKTFGENIILLLNRESETSLQLLTLKLLYLLFTTPSTHEYFYTNDLHVLVDILIRNLLDLPEESSALRHTYLRVLYPLLAHTQLRYPPHYKREEVKKLLNILVRGQFAGEDEDCGRIAHFEEVDETTKRLVVRCSNVEWLQDSEPESEDLPSPELNGGADQSQSTVSNTGDGDETSITTPVSPDSPSSPRGVTKRRSSRAISALDSKEAQESLGMGLETARSSSASVLEVASHKEKPGVMTPSRKASNQEIKPKAKAKPDPPKARRWRGRRAREEDEGGGNGVPPSGHDERSKSVEVSMANITITNGDSTTTHSPITESPSSIQETFPSASTSTTAPSRPPVPAPHKPRPHRKSLGVPAVPPPRRSSHSVPPPPPPPAPHAQASPPSNPTTHPSSPTPHSIHRTTSPLSGATTTPPPHPPQKPEPPLARRSRARRAQQQQQQQQQASSNP
ncbi:hypothetical protein FQN54_000541 [Arachnomyces sp. PD_36]|nr:hypothetical protein FQN54_000541 [Arachnomyces sp. PD_36]